MKKNTAYPRNNQIAQTQNTPLSNVQVTESISFSSPLLPPKLLDEYNKIIPTFAADLHKEVQRESNHRRSNENWIIKGTVIGSFIAQFFALGVCVYILYITYNLALQDKTTVAAILGGMDIVALAAVFLGTSYWRSKIRSEDSQPEKVENAN